MSPRKAHIAITPGGPITEEMIVGDYFWFNVSQEFRPFRTIKANWLDAGLPEDRIPRDRQKHHVAQEACRSVEGDYSNGTKRRVVVNEVLHNGAKLVYQVTLQTWDQKGETIEHEKSMRVTFSKKTGQFETFEALERQAYRALRPLEQQIRDHFDTHSSKIPGHKMREIIRHMLEAAGAENMSDSGRSAVYFITHDKVSLLQGVSKFLSTTYPGSNSHSRASLHHVPVANDEYQREMLKRKFIENCDEDLRALRDRLIDLVKQQKERQRGFRTDLIMNLQKERQVLLERRQRFADILNDKLTELDQSAELTDAALTKLLQEADVS
jgi:hypothetical protein